MTQKIESQEHKRLVRAILDHMKQKNFQQIKADIDGYPDKPDMTNGYIPDNSGVSDGELYIAEVELVDSYKNHKDQIVALAKSGNHFWLIVPANIKREVAEFYGHLGIQVYGL